MCLCLGGIITYPALHNGQESTTLFLRLLLSMHWSDLQLAKERGKLPPASEKHSFWGDALRQHTLPWVRARWVFEMWCWCCCYCYSLQSFLLPYFFAFRSCSFISLFIRSSFHSILYILSCLLPLWIVPNVWLSSFFPSWIHSFTLFFYRCFFFRSFFLLSFYLLSFFLSFFHSFLPFFPSFLPSFPSFLPSFLPPLPSFLPSFLSFFIPAWLLSFLSFSWF